MSIQTYLPRESIAQPEVQSVELFSRDDFGHQSAQAIVAGALSSFLRPLMPSSRETVLKCLREAADDMGAVGYEIHQIPWHKVTSAGLSKLVNDWTQEGLSKSTVRLRTYAVKGLLKSCFIHKLVPHDEFSLIQFVNVTGEGGTEAKRGRYVRQRQQDEMVRSCDEDERKQIGLRDKAFIALLFGAGLRRSEAVKVVIEDLDLTEGQMLVVVKGGKTQTRYLPDWAIEYLVEWRELLKLHEIGTGPVLRRLSKSGRPLSGMSPGGLFVALEDRCLRAGIPVIRPHDARRTLATDMIQDHGLSFAKKAMGHRNVQTTMIYDMTDDEAMRAIFKTRSR